MNLEHYQGQVINITSTPDRYPSYFGESTAQIPYFHPVKLLLLALTFKTAHHFLELSFKLLQKTKPSLIRHLETEICLPPDELIYNIGYIAHELKSLRMHNQDFRRGKLPGYLIEVK